jgi:hypothetical protein
MHLSKKSRSELSFEKNLLSLLSYSVLQKSALFVQFGVFGAYIFVLITFEDSFSSISTMSEAKQNSSPTVNLTKRFMINAHIWSTCSVVRAKVID